MVYEIDQQLRLLIEERNVHASAPDKTRGSIAEKENEVQAIPTLLSQMKPANRLPQVTALTLPKPNKNTTSEMEKLRAVDSSDSPILLIRVYESTMANLVKVHTELAGLRALGSHEQSMLTKFDNEISSLVSKQAQFDRATIPQRNGEL
jgi:hypothetical protein